MPWEYYPKITKRIEVVGDYLRDKVDEKVLIDLNCGESPILEYLSGFRAYYGNDVLIKEHSIKDNIHKLPITDSEFVYYCMENLEKKNNILLVLGHGGYPKHQNEHESKTINESTNSLIVHLKPEIIVLESAEHFSDVIDKHIELSNYTEALNQFLDLGNSWVEKRRVRAYERNSGTNSNL